MNRREFLRRAGVASAGLALTDPARLFAQSSITERWRTFEITTRIDVLQAAGATRVWLPNASRAQHCRAEVYLVG